ncbi:MAG: carboxyl transferase domain-containing protein [Oscillospiraceae bacterium]
MSETSKNMTASERLAVLFDDGVFTEIDAVSGKNSGAKAAYGNVGGATVFAFCQDSAVCGCAIDRAQSRKLAKVYDLAAKTGAPVITVYDSKGVKLDDGFASLDAASEILSKVSELSGVVPQIAVVVGECAGFSAMTAALADVCIMSESGELFMTSAFSDRANGGSEEGVGSAEFAQNAGIAGIICKSEKEAIAKAADVARLLPLNNLAALPVYEFETPAFDPAGGTIKSVADSGSIIELFPAIGCGTTTALATIGGTPCGMIEATGELCKNATAKAAKLVEFCDAFNIPVVSFVNATGFKKSAHGDRAGAIKNAAKLAHVMAEATTAKISVVTGSAIGSVFTTFCGRNGGADMAFAWDKAVISPITPEAAVDILREERITKPEDIAVLAKEYGSTVAGAQSAAEAGLVDSIIDAASTRDAVIASLDMLASKRVSRLPKKHGNLPL